MAEPDRPDGRLKTFEDFPVGTEVDLGEFSLSEKEIVDFAARFDPQLIHTDPEFAAAGPFGGLIASGWHTGAAIMRRYVDAMISDSDSRGSPGVEQLRWLRPVRPGDVIRAKVRIVDAHRSERTRGRGTVTLEWEARNQDDDVVLTMTSRGMFGTRDA